MTDGCVAVDPPIWWRDEWKEQAKECGNEIVCNECSACDEHCEHKKPMSLG